MFDTLSFAEISNELNTNFRVLESTEQVQLKLIEANELRIDDRQEVFSIVFLGPKDLLLPQESYELEHEKFGRGLLFLVPIAQNEDGYRYEAVFNRLIDQTT